MASEEPELVDRMDEDDKHFPSLDAEDGEAERDAEETDMFLCARCRQKKCRYRHVQIRSADEPKTTFVRCMICNYKWKFT